MPTLQEIEETTRVFSENRQYWLELPMVKKIVAIVAAIKESEGNRARFWDLLKSKTQYPFSDGCGCVGELADVCLHGGRVKLSNGRLIDWQIWKREHVVHLIDW